MKILAIVLFTIIVYLRTIKFTLIVDDIKGYDGIQKQKPFAWDKEKSILLNLRSLKGYFIRRCYGGATLGGHNIPLDHGLSILLHTMVCVLIYMVFGYSTISFLASLLYACNPVNHQTSMWLNGRRYTINIIIVLLMMLYSPWGLILYPWTFVNSQVACILSPMLVKGIHPIFWAVIPIFLALNYKRIKSKVDARMKKILCDQQRIYKPSRLIIIAKSYGFYFFNMLAPNRVMVNYSNLFWWGVAEPKNSECYKLNLEFWKGILAVAVSIAGVVYFQGYNRIMMIFMIGAILQWSAVFSAVQVNADRYISLPNVFMMYFMAYFVSMMPFASYIFVGIIVYYLTQLYHVMDCYVSIDWYHRYHMYNAPDITKPRFNRIEFYFKQNRFLTAWYLIEEGLQYNPNDFHLLFQASVALAHIGNFEQSLNFCEKAQKNYYMGQEAIQGKVATDMENTLVNMIADRKGVPMNQPMKQKHGSPSQKKKKKRKH